MFNVQDRLSTDVTSLSIILLRDIIFLNLQPHIVMMGEFQKRSVQITPLPGEHENHTSITILKFEQFCGYTYIIFFFLGTITNLLAMAIFLDFKPCKKGRKLLISTVLFLHLATSDFLTSLLVLSFNGFAFLHKTHDYLSEPFRTVCNISGAFFNICSRQSCNLFAIISFVRCVAVVRPFKHGIWFTKSRINLVLAVTWAISVLMSCMVFLLGKSYNYNDHITLCTWTLDDLGFTLNTVGKEWRSVAFFVLAVLPIFLPVTSTFICLSILIVYFSRNSKNRKKVRISLADMVEISEGFAQAMKNMLDSKSNSKSKQKLRPSLTCQKFQTENPKGKDKESAAVFRTMKKLKTRKVFKHLSDECPDQGEVIHQRKQIRYSLPSTSVSLTTSAKQNDFQESRRLTMTKEQFHDDDDGLTDCNGQQFQGDDIQMIERKARRNSSNLEFKEQTQPHQSPKPLSCRILARIMERFNQKKPAENLAVKWRRKAVNSQSHAFVTLIVIGTTFVLCYSLWCFFFICGFLATINPAWYILSTDGDTIILTMTTAILLINLNSCFTPCIHITRGNNLRNKLKTIGKYVEKGSKIFGSFH